MVVYLFLKVHLNIKNRFYFYFKYKLYMNENIIIIASDIAYAKSISRSYHK